MIIARRWRGKYHLCKGECFVKVCCCFCIAAAFLFQWVCKKLLMQMNVCKAPTFFDLRFFFFFATNRINSLRLFAISRLSRSCRQSLMRITMMSTSLDKRKTRSWSIFTRSNPRSRRFFFFIAVEEEEERGWSFDQNNQRERERKPDKKCIVCWFRGNAPKRLYKKILDRQQGRIGRIRSSNQGMASTPTTGATSRSCARICGEKQQTFYSHTRTLQHVQEARENKNFHNRLLVCV